MPLEIGQLTHLTRLDLSGNQLTSLPPEIGQLTNPSLSSRPSPELKTDREVRLEAKLQESRIANTGAVQDRKSAKAIPAGVLPTAQEIASSARSFRMEVCKAGFSTHRATWSRNRNFGCYYR